MAKPLNYDLPCAEPIDVPPLDHNNEREHVQAAGEGGDTTHLEETFFSRRRLNNGKDTR